MDNLPAFLRRRLPSLAASWVLALGVILTAATVATASCPNERMIHCGSFAYRVHGHRYKPSHIGFALNGHPSCGYARALIRAWLRNQTNRIYDSNFQGYWYKVATNPLEFIAGLCGDLRFRK